MTNLHKSPPLALTLRGYIQHAPERWRAHMAAAADAVEEVARLREERDAAQAKLAAMTAWLEREVPEVFRRGLWDAIDAALAAKDAP